MIRSNEPIFEDAFFRNKKKSGYRLVDAPNPALEAPVADTHVHLDMLRDAAFALARCAIYKVEFLCSIVDPSEDADTAYDSLGSWEQEAAAILPTLIENTEALIRETTVDRVVADEAPIEQATYDQIMGPGKIPQVRMAIGCHPHNAKHYSEELEAKLLHRLRDERTCAIGEVGLDYHYDFSPRETQREVFKRQIGLAHITGLPLILHLREAHDEAFQIMKEEGFPAAGTLLHCFNLDLKTLEPWLEQGCYAAFGGPVTFKSSDATREAAVHMPTALMLTETDAPYMTPEPMRGMLCGPEHVIFTAAKLAEVCKITPGEERKAFLETLYGNALELLDRKPTAWQSGLY